MDFVENPLKRKIEEGNIMDKEVAQRFFFDHFTQQLNHTNITIKKWTV